MLLRYSNVTDICFWQIVTSWRSRLWMEYMEQRLKVWILGVLLMVSSFGAKSADWFASEPIQFSAYHLFDMGVAKIDTDDYLDLFTANHSDEQGVFLGGV